MTQECVLYIYEAILYCFKILILIMCQCGGICISAVPLLESREVHGSYSAGVIRHLIWLSQLTWCWEQNLGLLQEQSWLLTEKQSLQSQLPFFASLPPPFFFIFKTGSHTVQNGFKIFYLFKNSRGLLTFLPSLPKF